MSYLAKLALLRSWGIVDMPDPIPPAALGWLLRPSRSPSLKIRKYSVHLKCRVRIEAIAAPSAERCGEAWRLLRLRLTKTQRNECQRRSTVKNTGDKG
jgi:hypothetical protein